MAKATINFSVNIVPALAALVITDPQGNVLQDGAQVVLPDEQVGAAVDQALFTVSGGKPPYQVTQTGVPDGESVTTANNPDGSMSVFLEGTPTTATAAGTPNEIAVTITDADGNTVTAAVRKSAPTA